jgi:hypothetical protein
MKGRKTIWVLSLAAALIGLFLFSGMFWAHLLRPLIFIPGGGYRTDGIFLHLSPFLFHVKELLSCGGCFGIPLLLLGILGTITLQPTSNSSTSYFQSHRLGLAAIGVSSFTHILILFLSIPFFYVPTGTGIRPMGWTFMMFVISAVNFLIAVPTAASAMKKERPPLLGKIGYILGFTPLVFAIFLMHFASWVKGFYLKP